MNNTCYNTGVRYEAYLTVCFILMYWVYLVLDYGVGYGVGYSVGYDVVYVVIFPSPFLYQYFYIFIFIYVYILNIIYMYLLVGVCVRYEGENACVAGFDGYDGYDGGICASTFLCCNIYI